MHVFGRLQKRQNNAHDVSASVNRKSPTLNETMASPLPRRTLRSSNRLSLSLSIRKTKPLDTPDPKEGQHGNTERNSDVNSVELSGKRLQQEAPEDRSSSVSMSSEARRERDYSPSPCLSLPKSSDIIILSEEENDGHTSLKTSMFEYVTPSKKQERSNLQCVTTGGKYKKKESANNTGRKTLPKKNPKEARKKISRSSSIPMLTKKYFEDSQKRITNFFTKTSDSQNIGYCRVLKESGMPTIITGNLDVEQMLSVEIEEGVERLSFTQNVGTTPADPSQKTATAQNCPVDIMERIEHAQSMCYDPIKEDWNMERVQIPVEYVESNLLDSIADSTTRCAAGLNIGHNTPAREEICTSPANGQTLFQRKINKSSRKEKPNQDKSTQHKRRSKIVCPAYKIIAGTNFAVDAFRYGDIEGVTHYFLTHFHADHYIGLKKSFCKPLIMSPITARLVKAFINVPEQHYRLIELHQCIVIDNVEIIALDANHCPGGIMFLFRLPDGSNILHTGDFRASPEMEEYPEFWNWHINCIYLDTTYLSSKYAFKSQWESVADARNIVTAYVKKHIGTKVLVVCGSYLIGKEKVWLELAVSLKMKVWTEPNRWKALKAIADPNQLAVLVADPTQANIHVLAMNKLIYDELIEHANQFPDQFDSVVALRPSGWEKNSKPQYRGRINIIGIEYSEHSSFEELKRFVQFLRPQEVISTVPYGNSNHNRTPSVPPSWYQGEIRPHRDSLQLSITRFMTAPFGSDGKERKMQSVRSGTNSIKQTKERIPRVNALNEYIETNVTEVIDLVSEDDRENIQCSEKDDLSFDSDWLL